MDDQTADQEGARAQPILDAVRDEDMEIIYRWSNDVDELPLWTPRRQQFLFEDFVSYVKERSRAGIFTVLRNGSTREPMGFMLGSLRERDGLADVVGYIAPAWRGQPIAFLAIGKFVRNLFSSYPIRKICCQTYGYNDQSTMLLRNSGFVEDGRLAEHVWWNDRYWDVHLFSLDRTRWRDGWQGKGGYARTARIMKSVEKSIESGQMGNLGRSRLSSGIMAARTKLHRGGTDGLQ